MTPEHERLYALALLAGGYQRGKGVPAGAREVAVVENTVGGRAFDYQHGPGETVPWRNGVGSWQFRSPRGGRYLVIVNTTRVTIFGDGTPEECNQFCVWLCATVGIDPGTIVLR